MPVQTRGKKCVADHGSINASRRPGGKARGWWWSGRRAGCIATGRRRMRTTIALSLWFIYLLVSAWQLATFKPDKCAVTVTRHFFMGCTRMQRGVGPTIVASVAIMAGEQRGSPTGLCNNTAYIPPGRASMGRPNTLHRDHYVQNDSLRNQDSHIYHRSSPPPSFSAPLASLDSHAVPLSPAPRRPTD